MYPVSDNYKEAIYAPVRTVKAKVTFDISDTTIAQDTITTDVTSEFTVSDKSQLTDKKRDNTYNYATFEPNRFRLDGSFSFADDVITNNKDVGWCSTPLCDDISAFSTPQVLTFTFLNAHSSIGITVTFDTLNNEYATEFTIRAYDGNNIVLYTADVINNNLVQVATLGQFYLYKKIEITINKWCKPLRRSRVTEVDFGVVRVYTDENLIKMSLIEELDLTTSKVPSAEFKFTVENANREFNILNPVGFYKFLQQRQQVIAELGIDVGGTVEYVQLGNYLLWDWISDEGSLTASFTAKTNLDLMSSFNYENLIAKSNYNLYQMAVVMFNICGITNYEIDGALQSINTLGLVKKNNCKNILQMISIASCSNMYVSRDNIIVIKVSDLSIGTAVDIIDMDNMYKEPQIQLDAIVRGIDVAYYSNLDTKQVVNVNSPGVTIGDLLKLENNTLINTPIRATNIANWILRQKNYRAIYTANWRGNPAHELNDIVTIEDSYGQNKNAFITKNELNYQGYLSGKTELRGEVT